jgi:uncharacterized membrane protein YgcG
MNAAPPVVQLDRVRLALAILDRLVADHPELRSDGTRKRLTDKFEELRSDEERAQAAFAVIKTR